MLPIPKFYNSADTVEQETYAFGNCDAGGYAPDSTGVIIHLWNDKDSAGSDDMTYIRLSVRDSNGMAWLPCGGIAKLCLRSDRDISSTIPGVPTWTIEEWIMVDNADHRPKLAITYTI